MFELKSAIEIFFDLGETLMILHVGFQLMVGFVLGHAGVGNDIFGVRYFLFSGSNLKT